MKERESAASNTTDAIPSNLSRSQRKRMRRKANQERREAEAKGILPTDDLSSLNQEATVTPIPLPPVPTPSTTTSDHVEADSAETPFVAYLSIVNFLNAAASSAGKSKAEIRVYDPYYCDGSVKRHLAKLGYNCYNENEVRGVGRRQRATRRRRTRRMMQEREQESIVQTWPSIQSFTFRPSIR
jgi:hypothetical protein